MHALSSSAELSARTPDPDALRQRLERLCDLLAISGARLTSIAADGPVPVAATAAGPGTVSLLERRVMAEGQSLVVANAAVEGQAGVGFYAGLLLPEDADRPPLLLSLFDTTPRSEAMAYRLSALAREVFTDAIIARQRRQIADQARTIATRDEFEAQNRRLFERASATARIGVWQCDLPDETLTWTNGVYDLFELPRGSVVTREQTLALYTEESRRLLKEVRSKAIATCGEFSMDAQIITAKGNRRWMRLTATVDSRDGVPTRIFGMKQDITEEKLMADRNRYLAECDVMTGLANRGLFQSSLDTLEASGSGALLLIDLDGFKQVNDTYGHALGDDCLREAANRLRDCCAGAALVARIGGDEFAALLGAEWPPSQVQGMAAAIVEMMRRPFLCSGQTIRLGASVGVAHNPGGPAGDLFRQADTALYAAKAAGRNTSRTFMPTRRQRSA